MKKLGFLAVLAMLAIGVSAQSEFPGPGPMPNNDNTANLNQVGWMQWGFIYQYGEGNTATINQGVFDDHHFPLTNGGPQHQFSYGNVAIISQIGTGNNGEIEQTGHGNYAFLMQFHFSHHHLALGADYDHQRLPYGEIEQNGSHNIASALQFGDSYLKIEQGGEHNFVGGIQYNHNPGITGTPQYSYQQNSNTNLIFSPLMVGDDEHITIEQGGTGDMFFGIGTLEDGKATIKQDVEEHHHLNGLYGQPQHSSHNYNAIFLKQKGGEVELTQNGKYNLIWLDVKAKHHNNPKVDIEQEGVGNVVAKFDNPYSPYASGPAEFRGESLNVTQKGFANRLSIESESTNGEITVTQTGAFNFGMIYQSNFHHHH